MRSKTRRLAATFGGIIGVLGATMSSSCAGKADGAATEDVSSVAVYPSYAVVSAGQTLPLKAFLNGTANTAVTWSVVQGDAGGTVSTSGLYQAPASTGVFSVVATSSANPSVSGSATVNVQEAPPSGTQWMTTASRTSGVAPLAVFFDAVDLATATAPAPFTWYSGVVQPANLEGTRYAWDFGDAAAGSWRTTGLWKNNATGFTAAHVFETPGTYTVTLTVTQLDGTVTSYAQQITVSAFGGTTYYVSAAGSDSNNGTSEATPFLTVARAMQVALATSGPVQVLFRRGDTFQLNAGYSITKAGPGIVGAYGTGNRPLFVVANLGFGNVFRPNGAGTDWVFQDLEFAASTAGIQTSPIGPPNSPKTTQLLVLRVKAHDFNINLYWGEGGSVVADPHDLIFLVDNEFTHGSGYQTAFGGRRLTFLGNTATDTTHTSGDGHLVRVWAMHKGVISQNEILRPGAQDHALKLNGTTYTDNRYESRWITITDNHFAGGPVSAGNSPQWAISIGSQSAVSGEATYVRYVQFERNLVEAGDATDTLMQSEAHHIVIRNNVFDMSKAAGTPQDTTALMLTPRNPYLAAPTDVGVYNNTIYKGNTGASSTSQFVLVNAGGNGPVTNLTIRNNLFGVASTNLMALISGSGTTYAADHNLLTATPGFTGAGTQQPFALSPTSPAVDAGSVDSDVRDDFVRTARPRGSGYDLGAFESH